MIETMTGFHMMYNSVAVTEMTCLVIWAFGFIIKFLIQYKFSKIPAVFDKPDSFDQNLQKPPGSHSNTCVVHRRDQRFSNIP